MGRMQEYLSDRHLHIKFPSKTDNEKMTDRSLKQAVYMAGVVLPSTVYPKKHSYLLTFWSFFLKKKYSAQVNIYPQAKLTE